MNYQLDTFVNRQEADALKEMIFRRVKERSEGMTEEVQDDIMDMARDSFVSKSNPFSQIVEKTGMKQENNTPELEKKDVDTEEIGFSLPHNKPNISNNNRLINEQVVNSQIISTMQEARSELSNKKSFMGALNFLNSQASISLIKTRGKNFEAVV